MTKNGFIHSPRDCHWEMNHHWRMLEKLVYSLVSHTEKLGRIYWYRMMLLMCQTHDTKEDEPLFSAVHSLQVQIPHSFRELLSLLAAELLKWFCLSDMKELQNTKWKHKRDSSFQISSTSYLEV